MNVETRYRYTKTKSHPKIEGELNEEQKEALSIASSAVFIFEQTHGRLIEASDCPLLHEIVSLNENANWREVIAQKCLVPHYNVPTAQPLPNQRKVIVERPMFRLELDPPPFIRAYHAYKMRKQNREKHVPRHILHARRVERPDLDVDETIIRPVLNLPNNSRQRKVWRSPSPRRLRSSRTKRKRFSDEVGELEDKDRVHKRSTQISIFVPKTKTVIEFVSKPNVAVKVEQSTNIPMEVEIRQEPIGKTTKKRKRSIGLMMQRNQCDDDDGDEEEWMPDQIKKPRRYKREPTRKPNRKHKKKKASEKEKEEKEENFEPPVLNRAWSWTFKLNRLSDYIKSNGRMPRAKNRKDIGKIGFRAHEWLSQQIRKMLGKKVPGLSSYQKAELLKFAAQHRDNSLSVRKCAEKLEAKGHAV